MSVEKGGQALTVDALSRLTPFLLPLFLLFALPGCEKVEADRLYAVRLAEPPAAENWEEGVPLELKAGGGNAHGRESALPRLDPETDPVHAASASCHHGPPVSDPVPLEIRAYYDDANLYLEVRWEDATPDTTPRLWRKGEEGWAVTDDEGDGLAILWSRYPGQYGCQEACHVDDWAVRGGSLVDVRHMYLTEKGAWEEAWVWKAAGGTRDLILGEKGFLTVAGEPYRAVNSIVARDESLSPEIRMAKTFGAGDGPAVSVADGSGRLPAENAESAAAYLWGGEGAELLLKVRGERWEKGWRVLFSRRLDAGEGRQDFRPGGEYRFGVALFDNTSLDHHIVRDTQFFTLVVPRS
jgi:hypothetical protein